MRTGSLGLLVWAVALHAVAFVVQQAFAQDASSYLDNDAPGHVQEFMGNRRDVRTYPEHWKYLEETTDPRPVGKSDDVWAPLWKELGPELTRKITRGNSVRIFDGSEKNVGARDEQRRTHPVRENAS